MKKDILQILFGSVLTALFIQVGLLSSARDFWTNMLSAIVVYAASRLLGLVFSGRSRW